MKYCKNCVMPDTKPGVYLDDRGLCNACRSQELKSQIDWEERFKDLEKLVSGSQMKYSCSNPNQKSLSSSSIVALPFDS